MWEVVGGKSTKQGKFVVEYNVGHSSNEYAFHLKYLSNGAYMWKHVSYHNFKIMAILKMKSLARKLKEIK